MHGHCLTQLRSKSIVASDAAESLISVVTSCVHDDNTKSVYAGAMIFTPPCV